MDTLLTPHLCSVPISEIASYYWNRGYKWFATQSDNGDEMLVKDPVTGKTHAPKAGEVFKNPTLAATFSAIAKDGKKGFYEGRIAEAIVDRKYSLSLKLQQHFRSSDQKIYSRAIQGRRHDARRLEEPPHDAR